MADLDILGDERFKKSRFAASSLSNDVHMRMAIGLSNAKRSSFVVKVGPAKKRD
jgi:hypothetical protein